MEKTKRRKPAAPIAAIMDRLNRNLKDLAEDQVEMDRLAAKMREFEAVERWRTMTAEARRGSRKKA